MRTRTTDNLGYTTGSPTQNTGAVSLRSMDMTGFYLSIPDASKGGGGNYTIYDESGNRYNYSYSTGGSGSWGVYGNYDGWRTDSNGNSITSTSGVYTDTINRTIPAPPPVVSSTTIQTPRAVPDHLRSIKRCSGRHRDITGSNIQSSFVTPIQP
jgi:hypothetical protein